MSDTVLGDRRNAAGLPLPILRTSTLGRTFYFGVGGTPQAAFDAAKAGGPPVAGHHSPLFKIDPEPSVRLGTEAMTVAVLDLLEPGAAATATH